MDMEAGKTLTNEEVIRELLELLKKNAMKEQANDVFEICSYVDGLEKKIDSMTEELTNMQNQIKEMQEDTFVNNAKKALSEAQERLNARCEQIKSQVSEVKAQVKSTAKSIVDEAKEKGRSALYRVSEFLGIKKRLLDIRENVRGAIKTTDKDIAKTALLAKGFREAGQTAANAFRTFADKPEVDYSQKEQKHPITKAVLAPMKAVKKMFVSMELHLDASIDKLDNLAMNVQLDKEKHMENAKTKEQTEPERAEAERVEAEVVYSPMVAEPQEYQYNAGITINDMINDICYLIGLDDTAKLQVKELTDCIESLGLSFKDIKVVLKMAYFYSVVDSTNSTGENAAPVNNTEYAFQLEIDTSKALPESLKIFNIQRVGVAVWNTERSKIISQMNLYKPEDLLKEI